MKPEVGTRVSTISITSIPVATGGFALGRKDKSGRDRHAKNVFCFTDQSK
jgi:hypothetical protein